MSLDRQPNENIIFGQPPIGVRWTLLRVRGDRGVIRQRIPATLTGTASTGMVNRRSARSIEQGHTSASSASRSRAFRAHEDRNFAASLRPAAWESRTKAWGFAREVSRKRRELERSPQNRDRCARHRSSPRNCSRSGGATLNFSKAGSQSVRLSSRHVPDAQEPEVDADIRARPGHRRRPQRAMAGHRVQDGHGPVFCHAELGSPLDPSKLSRVLFAARDHEGGDHQAVPRVPRPAPHRDHPRRRRRQSAGVRADEGGPFAGRRPRSGTSTRPRCCSPVLPTRRRPGCLGRSRASARTTAPTTPQRSSMRAFVTAKGRI